MSSRRSVSAAVPVFLLLACSSIGIARASTQESKQPATLQIVVIAGEDAVNVIQQQTAVAPIVEVRDENKQPVAGAIVTFTVRGGNATLGGGSTMTATTNVAGRAAASQLTASAPGAVRIDVVATAHGQTASATITQTNYATAAQAASGARPSQGGHTGKIVGISAAAAAAGGAYAFKDQLIGDEPVQPAIAGLQSNPGTGIVLVTPIDLLMSDSTWEVDRTTFTINWGDGETWSGPSLDTGDYPLHIYRSTGAFTIRLTIADKSGLEASATTAVTIRSLTGRWVSNAGTLDLVQNGTDLGGTYVAGSNSGSVSGRVSQPTSSSQAQLVMTVSGSGSFTGTLTGTDTFFGSFNNGPNITFRRQ